MNYAKELSVSASCLLFLAFATLFPLNAEADEIVSYADGSIPMYYNADITPDEAYRQLVAGNARYLKEDSSAARSLPSLTSAQNRFPIASIVYSSDMPVKPTVLTQTSDHDLYMTTMESGAVSNEELTAIEYGLINLQTPLLVVLGHYPSRTVTSLIRQYDVLEERARAETSRIATSSVIPNGTTSEQMKLYNLVGPAIARSREAYPDLQGYDLANVVSEALVWQSLETILLKSTVAQDLIRAGRLNIIAAIADDKTGKIYWLGTHPLQEEFLKPLPESLANKEAIGILTESELPSPLDDASIQEYVSLYENDPYYEDIVSEYYVTPIFYQPSWELFSPRAWTYRPWYGVWYDPFVPWPYWSPWGALYGESVLGVSQWDGRLRFFVAYNRSYGVPVYYDPHFRPHDPWWRSDYFTSLDRRRHDVVFDLIISGRRNEVPIGPRSWRPPHESHGYRPGVARPGIVVGLGGLSIGISGSPRRPPRELGRPGGPVDPISNGIPGGSPRFNPVHPNDPRAHFNRRRDTPRVIPSERSSVPPGAGRDTSNGTNVQPNTTPKPNGRNPRVVPNDDNTREKPNGASNPFPTRRRTASPRDSQSTPNANVHPAVNHNFDGHASQLDRRNGETGDRTSDRLAPSSNRRSAFFPNESSSTPIWGVRPTPNLNPNSRAVGIDSQHGVSKDDLGKISGPFSDSGTGPNPNTNFSIRNSNIESRDVTPQGGQSRIPSHIPARSRTAPFELTRPAFGNGSQHQQHYGGSGSFVGGANAFSRAESASSNQSIRPSQIDVGRTGASVRDLRSAPNVGSRPGVSLDPINKNVGFPPVNGVMGTNSPIRSATSPMSHPRHENNSNRPTTTHGARRK